jgi:type IV pilus assembly protein PilQ
MHEVSGLNIVLDPAVAGTVTIVLEEVPWDQAMDIVLKNNSLGKEVVGNVVRVARLSTLEAEEKQRLALAQAIEQAQPRNTVTRTLSYATAGDLVTPLKRFLSPRGDLVPDARTNTLIITDVPGNIAQIDQLIGALDRKTQQVEIEARVVAASRQFARDIGSQLAASGATGNFTLGGTGQVGESPILRGTVPPLFIGQPPTDPTQFANVAQPLATNLPAIGPTSGFTFLYTSSSRFALDAIITAAERKGTGKLLSRPKVITQNNVEAMVKQGVRIPIQTNINNTITTQYVDVVLRLTVTPQITAEGTVFLKTDVENTAINSGIQLVSGIPALNTQQATTQVLVTDGGTVFFGGVIQTDSSLTEQQVPLLGSIPLVGNLFKRKSTSSTTNELLFFITPKIVQS